MRKLLTSLAALQLLACASASRAPTQDLRHIEANGAEITYAVDGSGPPLVIIHGAWGDLRSFSRVVPTLATAHTVVRVSLRLHWPNRWPTSEQDATSGYRAENHAADVAALIERLGLGPASVLGHSYGGVVAALLAQARPDLVRRLVLAEPSLFGILRERPEGEKVLEEERNDRDTLLAELRAGKDPLGLIRDMYGPERFDAFPDARRRTASDNARTLGPILAHSWIDIPYACADARSLTMPVLLVEGAKTGPVVRDIDDLLLGCLRSAQRVVIPDSGHAMQYDAPDQVARVVTDFLKS